MVGPWRSPRGRILAFFAWGLENADRFRRYVCARCRWPRAMRGKDVEMAPPVGHLRVVEGLLDVHLARSLRMACVVGLGGTLWGAVGAAAGAPRRRRGPGGDRDPPDDERGRDDTLSVLEAAGSPLCDGVRFSVVDPALVAGGGDLGELVRRRRRQALRELHAWRMESELYRFVMVPLQ